MAVIWSKNCCTYCRGSSNNNYNLKNNRYLHVMIGLFGVIHNMWGLTKSILFASTQYCDEDEFKTIINSTQLTVNGNFFFMCMHVYITITASPCRNMGERFCLVPCIHRNIPQMRNLSLQTFFPVLPLIIFNFRYPFLSIKVSHEKIYFCCCDVFHISEYVASLCRPPMLSFLQLLWEPYRHGNWILLSICYIWSHILPCAIGAMVAYEVVCLKVIYVFCTIYKQKMKLNAWKDCRRC